MSDDSSTGDGLQIELSSRRVEMLPGGSPVEVTLVVRNDGRVVEQCTVEVVGLDADWFTHPARSVALFPADSDSLKLTFHVPLRADLRAGTYPFAVVARSRSSGVERRVEGVVAIAGQPAYDMDIAPRRLVVRDRGRFRVQLTNSGMADGELQLDASDAEDGVRFEFLQDRRRVVPANTTVEVPVQAVPRRRPWIGPPRTYDFQITARQPDSVAEVRSVQGQLVYQPRFASLRLLRRLVVLAALVVALLVALSVMPSTLRCRLAGENVGMPVLGRGCGADLALSGGGGPLAQSAPGGAPASPAAGAAGVVGAGGGAVSAGGGGAAGVGASPAADQQAAGLGGVEAIGGGGGAAGAGMSAEGVPTAVPSAATAAAVFMAGLDATQAAAATAVATPTVVPATLQTAAATPQATTTQAPAAAKPAVTPTPTVLAAQFAPGTCSGVQQPPPRPAPTRAPAARPSAVAAPTPTRAATVEGSQSDPTAWWYCTGVTADQLGQFLKSNQARLLDVEVEQAQPTLLLSGVAVLNQGAYARDWWWYFGLEDAQVQERLATNSARPIALNAYDAGGGNTRFAVVMVSNKPPETRNYWWFPDLPTVEQIDHLLTVNQARLVDVQPYVDAGDRRYALVMLANDGADQTSSSWFDDISADQISAEVSRTGGHVIDIQPNNVAGGTFDVVLEACPCARNWWAVGLDDAGLTNALAQTHGRITSLATYLVQGQRRFAVSLIDNS